MAEASTSAAAAAPLDAARLARHYSRFRVTERTLLTGHSHQAWPDCCAAAHQQAWEDAAAHVDDKWAAAARQAERVRRGLAELLDDPDGQYTLGSNTHELLVRWLSALPLRARPRIVTTDSEFYSAERQLARLEEEGVEVVRVPASPAATVGERLTAAVDERTAAVIVSAVFFNSAEIAGGLADVAAAAEKMNAELLVDVYHALGALPISLSQQGLRRAYAVGGGYKYLQLGEGNCFLRYPPDSQLRPVITGWFSDFASLGQAAKTGAVRYGTDEGCRFAGATYDPTSHYRAAAVFDFFREQGMTPAALRASSQRQLGLLRAGVLGLGLPPHILSVPSATLPLEGLGGFLVLRTPAAERVQGELRRRGVWVDHRGDLLRMGPAPYVTDAQIEGAVAVLGEIVMDLAEKSADAHAENS